MRAPPPVIALTLAAGISVIGEFFAGLRPRLGF